MNSFLLIYVIDFSNCNHKTFNTSEWEFGIPYENPDQYEKWSPENFIRNWKTPTLIIHG